MDEKTRKKLKKKFEDFINQDIPVDDSDIPVSEKKVKDEEIREI